LVTRGEEPGRLVLGTLAARGGRPTRRVLAAEPLQSLAVVGPTQSGKTTALAVPAILGWSGPVVAASVKTDLVRDTLAWRRRCGTVWCFDPARVTGLCSARWSPIPAARTWPGARRVANDLIEVARGTGTTADGEFWYATAAKLLAPLFFAAATGGCSIADVVRWVDTQEVAEVADILEGAGVPEALQAARASWQRDERQRSSVYTTAETVLEPFCEPPPDAGPDQCDIDCEGLLTGANTLYLCAPAHDQRRLRGLFTAVVKQVLDAAFTRSARAGAPLRPGLLVVLDEAANIASPDELDGLAATSASHGIQLVTVFQDLAQVTARYGPRASTVLNNHRAKMFLSGTADAGTLDQASHLVGDEEVLVPSVTRGPGGPSTTSAQVQRRLLAPDALRRLPAGTGVLVYGALPPVHVALRPWWADPVLASRAATRSGRPATPGLPGPADP
jgi:type IV secretion system protein VirD4